MKCDELKSFNCVDSDMQEFCEPRLVYPKGEVDAAIAELKDENRKLKRELEHVKNGDCINTCDVVEKHVKEEIKAKRALWLERAERAKETQFLWQVYCHCDKLYFCKPFCVSTRKNPYRHISRMNVVEWDEFWGKIKNKCLAKAEEYK